MSTLLPTNIETDAEGRLQRVQALRGNQIFQTLVWGKIGDLKKKAAEAILSMTTPDEDIPALRRRHELLSEILDILDSEERAARVVIEQQQKGK